MYLHDKTINYETIISRLFHWVYVIIHMF